MDANRSSGSDGFEHYMKEKRRADCDVATSDLQWVILRPGKLHSEYEDDGISAGMAIPYRLTSRDNVAGMLAWLVDTSAIAREIIEMTDGEQMISDVIRRLTRSS